MCGHEIENMMDLLQRYSFDSRELTRHADLDIKFIEVCEHSHRGTCTKFGSTCKRLHHGVMDDGHNKYVGGDEEEEWAQWNWR